MIKGSHYPSRVQGTINNKKSDFAKFASCTEVFKGVFFRMTSNIQHENEALNETRLYPW